jgi:tripartite-type tricarboxylate transporter receptor subunit TctC
MKLPVHSLLRFTSAFAAAIAVCAATYQPAAAEYPDRPIRMIVAYAAGGTADIVGRVVGEALSVKLGVPVAIENQGGAAGAIAAQAVAKSDPDGYTILLGGSAMFGILPHITKVNYDPVNDFTPIANLGESQRVIAVNNDFPAKTLAEFVAYGRANKGKLNFGSAGIGSSIHVMTEIFLRDAGIEAVHLPFRGSALAIQALMRGDIHVYVDGTLIPQVQQGSLRALAAATDQRLAIFPDLPTLAELGYPNVRTSGWQAILGPAKMPANAIAVINRHLAEIYKDPAFLERLKKAGVVPRYRNGEDLAAELREDSRYFGDVIQRYKISAK